MMKSVLAIVAIIAASTSALPADKTVKEPEKIKSPFEIKPPLTFDQLRQRLKDLKKSN